MGWGIGWRRRWLIHGPWAAIAQTLAVSYTLRNAGPGDASQVSHVARAAKAYWGYPTGWLETWADDLTVSSDYLLRHRAFVATRDDEVIGVCVLEDRQDGWALEHVWVLPDAHGRGVGRALVGHALRVAHEARPGRVRVVSDPFAAPFYLRLGARQIGEVPAPMPGAPGRTLPLMELGTAPGPTPRGAGGRGGLCVLPLLMALTASAASAVGQANASRPDSAAMLWAGLEPGPHHVGYRVIVGTAGVVHTWYPTTTGGTPLRFRDYAADDAPRLDAFLTRAGVSPTTVAGLFGSMLYGTRSPRPPDRPRALVLVAQGNGQDVVDQVVLCEYLASLGFIVAAPPSPTLRMPLEREDQVGAVAEAQADALAAAIDAVAAVLPVDEQRLGVMGHSFGARAALLLAMRDRRIRALVSLDGGIGTATAIEPFRAAPSFDADAPLPPLLLFFEELDPFMAPDFGLVRSLHTTELVLVPTEAMHHVHFTTYGFASAVFPDVAVLTHATAQTGSVVRTVVERSGAFLLDRLR